MKMHVNAGDDITSTINRAGGLAEYAGDVITFEFNGVTIRLLADTNPDLVYRDWQRALEGCIPKVIGPEYAAELTKAEQEHDAEVREEGVRRRAEAQAAYDRAAQKKADAVANEIGDETMAFSDVAEWEKGLAAQTDGYGQAVFSYAKRWARLMQARMCDGKSVADVAEKASYDANVEGITGFMYGAAVSILAKSWQYGEALRTWHNLDTQLGSEGEKANEEGGVLNPALLCIGSGK